MLLGNEGEAKKIRAWERKHKTQVFTSGTNHVAALRALKVKRFIGASYFQGEINETFGNYFKKEGFDVLGMEGIDVPFNKVQPLSSQEIYSFIKKLALKNKRAQGFYMLGE